MPLSDPPQHDELLFIIQHQTSELWLKLMVHELRSARALLATDDLSPALKRLARVKHIQRVLTDQWSVLATLTPSEYAEIRPFLATSSGFQSAQYREVEFLLGNKDAEMVKVFGHDPAARDQLATLLHEPSLYDEFLRHLAREGYAVPADLLDRDWSQRRPSHPGLVDVYAAVYAAPHEHWGVYETCEELVDVEDNFQEWRFRHLQVVQRTIGQQARHRRLLRRRLPAPRPRPHLLPRALRGPRPHRRLTAGGRSAAPVVEVRAERVEVRRPWSRCERRLESPTVERLRWLRCERSEPRNPRTRSVAALTARG